MSARAIVLGTAFAVLQLWSSGCYCSGGPDLDCHGVGSTCSVNEECCSFGCEWSGQCICNPEKRGTCRTSGDCCRGMRCTNQECEVGCRRPGEACGSGSDCCGEQCTDGACVGRSACGTVGQGCSDVDICCEGVVCQAGQSHIGPTASICR